MIRGDKVTLSFFDSITEFEFLGEGQSVFAFTTTIEPGMVWLVAPEHHFRDGSVVEDASKDVLVDAYKASPKNPYLAKIEFMGADIVYGHQEINGVYSKIYRMKYYRDLVREDDALWMEMKHLHKIRADGKNLVYDLQEQGGGSKPSLSFLGNEAAQASAILVNRLGEPLAEAIKCLYSAILTKGRPGLTFEFNLRNVGVDENNHLVLRDPVFDSEITIHINKDLDEEAEELKAQITPEIPAQP